MAFAQVHTSLDDIASLPEDETPALRIWSPAGRVRTIPRPRLVAQLAGERARSLVAVRAPAGYGKTTFAEQWCRSDDRPVAWVSLRESDNEPVQLLSRLTTALESLDSVDPGLMPDLSTPGTAPVGVLFSRFLDDLALWTPFLLALDDAHVIDRPSAVRMLKGLANSIPPRSQLVLVSRTDTPMGLARMRAAGKVCEVGPGDLALDQAETRRLFSVAGVDLTDEETTELRAVSEGWPAGLALVATSHSRTGRGRSLATWPLGNPDVADYFREEVLDLESDRNREFLFVTSALDRLSGPLCDALTDRDDSGLVLTELATSNHFVIALDGERRWYRYHHLFKDLLQAELRRRGDAPMHDLFNRAAAWHEQHGDPAEAFGYALRGQDFDRAGRILLGHWDEFLGSGMVDTVMNWLDSLQEADIESDPQLAIAAGWVTLHIGDAERANRYLAAAERMNLEAPSPDGTTSLRASMTILRAALGTAGPTQMLEDARTYVASELPARSRYLFTGYLYLGVAHLTLGHTAEAIRTFDETLVLTEPHSSSRHVHARAYSLGLAALAHADGGDWVGAERRARMAEQLLEECDLVITCLPILAARATVAAHDGDGTTAAAAVAEVQRNLPTALAIPIIQAELSLRCAQVAHVIGEDEAAEVLATEAQSACLRVAEPGSMPARLNVLRERIAGINPRMASLTPAERRVLRQLASHRTLSEIATHLYVSRSTVKTHVASIYAKLGVSVRDQAVAALGDGLDREDP